MKIWSMAGAIVLLASVTGQAWGLRATDHNTPPPVPSVLDGVFQRYNPFRPSGGPYPYLRPGEKLWVDVSISQQLVYILNGSRVIYIMATSSGMESIPGDESPLGVYHIQHKRGTWFYAPQYKEGAAYWVSWLGNGVYLFHSVPMDEHHHVLPEVSASLLHEASHGCFHLTVPDARWFYEHVPYKATLVVEQAPVWLSRGFLVDPSADQRHAIEETSDFGNR
ncbi:MAG: L,D-transpeptidase [Spirochaetales bacterium]|nr:L,D-transpeptidase [Spirochaetales bacterium]